MKNSAWAVTGWQCLWLPEPFFPWQLMRRLVFDFTTLVLGAMVQRQPVEWWPTLSVQVELTWEELAICSIFLRCM